MPSKRNAGRDIPTQIKNQELVEFRRRQIIEASIQLFVQNGFHKTTTRQIAQAAGFSIGSLYEYVASKEDVLYLVCDAINTEVQQIVESALKETPGEKPTLKQVLREYFMVCHRMSDFILLMYQETRSLPDQWQKKVLENELAISGLFVQLIAKLVASGDLPHMDTKSIELTAHDITVLGHMWSFRRWFLGRHYRIEDYTNFQIDFIMGGITRRDKASGRA